MPLFVCDKCNCLENTALSRDWFKDEAEADLCSECDPKIGHWHNLFEKRKWNVVIDGIINRDTEYGNRGRL